MTPIETVTDDVVETAVLARAKRNFLNDGLGDRMWADPSTTEGAAMSECFLLSEEQRAAFIADARAEIENERGSSSPVDPATT